MGLGGMGWGIHSLTQYRTETGMHPVHTAAETSENLLKIFNLLSEFQQLIFFFFNLMVSDILQIFTKYYREIQI